MMIKVPFVSGVQYKTVVEYAPSQRVPKLSTRKDGREGTVYKGTNLVHFLLCYQSYMSSWCTLSCSFWSKLLLHLV